MVTGNQNLEHFLQYWLQSVKSSVRPRTFESYELDVQRLVPLVRKRRLNGLSPALVEQAYAELAPNGLSNR